MALQALTETTMCHKLTRCTIVLVKQPVKGEFKSSSIVLHGILQMWKQRNPKVSFVLIQIPIATYLRYYLDMF